MNAHPLTAMLLAAGRGERLRPLTDAAPKPLLEVGGKPLIVHALERIRAAGIERVVVNTSWLAEQLHAALGDGADFGVELEWSDEGPVALETGGGIRRALPLLSDPFLVVNADVWCDADLGALELGEGAAGQRDVATLLMVDNPPHNPRGDFVLDAGRLRAPRADEPRLTYSGLGLYRHALFAGHHDGRFPLAPLLLAGMRRDIVGGVHHRGRWSDAGTPERLAALDTLLGTTLR
jgi:N-acetyl-alpha-D-muramate 1-phosphate uridylyltransferase